MAQLTKTKLDGTENIVRKRLLTSLFSSSYSLLNTLLHNEDFLQPNTRSLLKTFRLGKGENAGNQRFLLFPQCFVPFIK